MAETFQLHLRSTEAAGRCAKQLGNGTSESFALDLLTSTHVLAVNGLVVAYGLNG
jgi:hypothetical protein